MLDSFWFLGTWCHPKLAITKSLETTSALVVQKVTPPQNTYRRDSGWL
jgi:hypothetical protein